MTTVTAEMGRYDREVMFSKVGASVLQTSKAELVFSKAKAACYRREVHPVLMGGGAPVWRWHTAYRWRPVAIVVAKRERVPKT